MLELLENIKTTRLKGLRITLLDILPYIQSYDKGIIDSVVIGKSHDNRDIYRLKVGEGNVKILMWAQMHGDESTATKSLIDLVTFVNKEMFTNVYLKKVLDNLTLYIIPILNPDGAEVYTRENFLNADLNRDAKEQKHHESKILSAQIDLIKPDFAFNLHDQTSYYNVAGTNQVASLSFLAPAFDMEKSVNKSRKKAMELIGTLYEGLQSELGGNIGRYNDTYCDSCFGDYIQSLGIPTILIESGYIPGDKMREQTRAIHTKAILIALDAISRQHFSTIESYYAIPKNEKLFYDLSIKNVVYDNELVHIGVRYQYKYIKGNMVKVIDYEDIIINDELENYYFHDNIDAGGKDLSQFSMIKI
jgi:hypothetical protein